MADEEMQADRLGHRLDQVHPELAGAGAAVEDDHSAVRGSDLDAGGIPSEPRGARAGRGDRSTRSPEANLHGG